MLTATTAEEIFVGAGELWVDDELVGATMENNVFRVVQEKGAPKLNGVPGPIKGLDYISSETAELEATIPQLSPTILGYTIPGSVSVVGDAIGVATGALTDLDGATLAGATSIVVTSGTGIANGEVIQIGAAGSREFRTVASGGGTTTLVLNVALTSAHADAEPVQEVVSSTLAADAPAGSTNLKMTAVTGLVVGDYLRFGYPGEQEVRRLTFVGTTGSGGTGVSFDVPTARAHLSGQTTLEQTNEGATTITSGAGTTRRLPSTAYHDVELRVPGLDGREARFRLSDAIAIDNPEYEASDDPEAPLAPRITWQCRWDPAASTVSPWSIAKIGPTA